MPELSRYSFLACGLLLAAASVACSGGAPAPKADTPYLTVFVAKDGAMEVNGQEASIMELENALKAAAGAVVLFHREAPERNRAPLSMMVLRIVRERQLPLRFCRKRDFSDAIGPDGKLRPE